MSQHRRFVALIGCLLWGCSSSSSGTTGGSGPAPIAHEIPSSDLTLQVIANFGAERLVMGSFQVGGSSPSTCTSEKIGGCTLSHCSSVGGPGMPGTTLDAGKVTVTSASIGDHVELPIMSGYGRIVQMGDFADAEDVLVSGAGGKDVPAFDLHAIVPPKVTVTRFGSCEADAKSCDLADASPVAEWTGGAGAVIGVSLTQVVDIPNRATLSCAFDAGPGKGQLPAEAMAKLPKDTSYSVSFTAVGTKVTSGRMGLYPMRFVHGGPGGVKLAF